jgi:hypothetical protein
MYTLICVGNNFKKGDNSINFSGKECSSAPMFHNYLITSLYLKRCLITFAGCPSHVDGPSVLQFLAHPHASSIIRTVAILRKSHRDLSRERACSRALITLVLIWKKCSIFGPAMLGKCKLIRPSCNVADLLSVILVHLSGSCGWLSHSLTRS